MRYVGIILLICWSQLLFGQDPEVLPDTSGNADVELAAGDPMDAQVQDTLGMAVADSTAITTDLPVEETPSPNSEFISDLPMDTSMDPLPVEEDGVEVNALLEPVMVKYTTDFEFQDGIYANFDMVLNNDPIPTARIVTDLDMFDRAFFEKITAGKQIVIYDENGVKKELPTNDVWGYGRNGVLYINVGSAFHRISMVGRICHFVATVTTYSPNYYDPYYYNPYYSSSYYYNRYSMPQTNMTSTDLRQYVLDFETGDIMEYDEESVEVLLMKDPELADEYLSLSKRKRKQMKFVFIRRFNEKHPLYFPAY